MSKSDRSIVSLFVALILSIAGLLLSLYSLRVTPTKLTQLHAKQQRLQQLADLRAERDQADQGFKAFVGSENTLPSSVSVVIENVLPKLRPGIEELDPLQVSHGANLRRVKVDLGELDLRKMNPLLRKLEAYDPPWRILECHISAVERRGWGRVTLALEALEKL